MINITGDTFSASFSFNVLMTCGSMDVAVNIPAAIPTTEINK